jgi:hypothetical protein
MLFYIVLLLLVNRYVQGILSMGCQQQKIPYRKLNLGMKSQLNRHNTSEHRSRLVPQYVICNSNSRTTQTPSVDSFCHKKRSRVVVDSLNFDVNENSFDTATDKLELERNQAAGYDVRVRSSIEYKNCEMQASVCMVDASSQWEELHLVDHSYVRKSVTGKVSMAMQVALPAYELINKFRSVC